jgi:DNA-binding SARP family transcriptional activator/predicted ATPase/Tfp pilus assembly protein PilF
MELTLRLRFLGPLQVERDGEPVRGLRSRKALALLGYLAVQGQPVPREQLADLFWEERSESRGRANLSWALNRISSVLTVYLQTDRHSVQFQRTDAYWLDIDAFEELEARGDAASLTAAVELCRGEFLEGLYLDGCPEFEIWLVAERERWRERVAQVLGKLVAHHSRRGAYEQGLRFARRLLALEPWREGTQRQVMGLLARSGQREAALAQYETCRRVLAEELGVEPMVETTALYERILAVSSTRRHNLPAQPTPFVGREEELAEMVRLLGDPDCRLLTAVGPGGIGKTRLALRAASARGEAFLEGVYFVPLVGVSSADFVVSAIADALQFSLSGPRDPQSQLLNYLRGKEVLLVLDSFEHLLEGTELLGEILQQAPEVKLLVTSRERLNLRWEWCFEVGGLKYPVSDITDEQELKTYGAVQLFQQTARRVSQRFLLASHDEPAVVRICRLVEGMPLGIDLAASWVGTRTCTGIAEEIAHNLSFLATALRDVPKRHQSVQATFEGSWRLLTPAEQRAFMTLSVFSGGFSREAASEVAGASSAVLGSLVNKSLLRFLPSGRYEMHELLRQCAAEKLEPQAQTVARDRHCVYFATFLQSREGDLIGAGVAEALAAIKAEIGNVRAAWHWAVAQGKLEEIERSLGGLSRFYLLAGPFQEAEMLVEMAVSHVRSLVRQEDGPGRASMVLGELLAEQARFLNERAKHGQAILAAQAAIDVASLDETHRTVRLRAVGHLQWGRALWRQADYAAGQVQLERALALAQSARLRQIAADALRHLGLVRWHLGDYAEAKTYCEQALCGYREIGDRRGESGTLNNLGLVAKNQDDYRGARVYFEQALSILSEIGARQGESIVLGNLGLISNQQGDYAGARAYYEQALHIDREIGNRQGEGIALINLGYVSDQQGDYAGARTYYEQSLRIYRETGNRQGESLALACLGLLSHHLSNDKAACDYGQEALHIAQEIGNRHVQGYALTRLGHALKGLGRLAEAAEVYQQALALRQELGQPNLAIEPLAGLARVSLAQGDALQAQAQVEEILNHIETGTLDGTDEPLRVYLTCYRVLVASQDLRAQGILSAAHRLLQERAAKIGDEDLRRSYLENVPAHREILNQVQTLHS